MGEEREVLEAHTASGGDGKVTGGYKGEGREDENKKEIEGRK